MPQSQFFLTWQNGGRLTEIEHCKYFLALLRRGAYDQFVTGVDRHACGSCSSILSMSVGMPAALRTPSALPRLITYLSISNFFVLYRSAGSSHRFMPGGGIFLHEPDRGADAFCRADGRRRHYLVTVSGRAVLRLAGSVDVTTEVLDTSMTYLISTSAYASYSGGM